MNGNEQTLTRPLITRFTRKMSHTASHGSAPLDRNGRDPNAPMAKIRLSSGMLTAFDTSTRSHWYRVVTRVTNQWYTSVSTVSLTTMARIEANTIRQIGPSTAEYSAPSPQLGSLSTPLVQARWAARNRLTPALVQIAVRAARRPSALCTTSRRVNVIG